MAEPAPEEGFKVTDRRRRDDAAEAPAAAASRPAEAPRPASSASRIIDPSRPASAASRPVEPARQRAAPPGPSAPASAGDKERNLSGLFMMLASEAVIALGDAADPVTGERHRELPHAADLIDLLALLREKTEGNRSLDETQILDELIYDLQMRYVRASRPS